mgnify:CR=1 FL=1
MIKHQKSIISKIPLSAMDTLNEIFNAILPYLIEFMNFSLPIALAFGEAFKNLIKPFSYLMPDNSFFLYILVFIVILGIAIYYNFKYPYRKKPKKI